jgi:hypothetical protein
MCYFHDWVRVTGGFCLFYEVHQIRADGSLCFIGSPQSRDGSPEF